MSVASADKPLRSLDRRARRGARPGGAALGPPLARADRAAVREPPRRRRRRALLRGGLVGHGGAPPLHGARRRRSRRRGDHLALLLRRVGELRDLCGCDARVRRRRRRHAEPRSGRGRGGDHAAHEGDRRRRHLRLPLRARRAPRDLRPPRPLPRRGRLRGARRRLQGPPARLARPPRHLGLLSEQADHDRRGRSGHDGLRGGACDARLAPEPGPARDLELAPARPARVQLPARRHLRGARDRPARAARHDPRRAAKGCRALHGAPRRASTSRRRCPTTPTTSARGSSTS